MTKAPLVMLVCLLGVPAVASPQTAEEIVAASVTVDDTSVNTAVDAKMFAAR